MIKVVIVDDEPKAIELLSSEILKIDDTVNIIGRATSILDGIRILKQSEPDLVFLDIQLKEGTGFEIIEQLDEINFEIVFTTAFDQYAIEAFKVSALDYLLKPIEEEELRRVMIKAKNKTSQDHNKLVKKITSLIGEKVKSDRLIIKEKGQVSFVKVDDILYLSADGSYTKIMLKNGKSYITSKNLAYYGRTIFNSRFLRVHRSYMINVDEVVTYSPSYGRAEMTNGDKVRISDNVKEEFMEKMQHK